MYVMSLQWHFSSYQNYRSRARSSATPLVSSTLRRRSVMATETLQNLTEQSARVGTFVLSAASRPRTENYSFSKGNGKGNDRKFECLIGSDKSEEYCLGQFKRKGKEPAVKREFKRQKTH